ncbi:MAG: hypothetical protein QOH35_464 [Acidobacteriaceae bacterium]|nr:hypothetical protein [Acidobacteriaceae bacterium]MDX6462148.1 hypothetical protein [Acidobacteriaceae bacterium]MEA2539098.1 hypothetical protein [Acidobacteriaceae bacterium]
MNPREDECAKYVYEVAFRSENGKPKAVASGLLRQWPSVGGKAVRFFERDAEGTDRSVDECIGDGARINRTELPPPHAVRSSFAAPFRASMALTLFTNAFSKTPWPMVLSTKPSSRPLRFLPSRTTTTSMVGGAVGNPGR